MKGWWYSATTEQKLAQVKAGIELGMTAEDVAFNCGCNTRGTVISFAATHGLRFPKKFTEKMRAAAIEAASKRSLFDRSDGAPRDLVSGLKEWGWQ